MNGHCLNCGTRLESAGCPNCSDEAFAYTESMKNRWAAEDSERYEFPPESTRS
jgi:hypothetical protein